MIDLHERLSEFSYGYGVTREVEVLLAGVGLTTTPFLPSLLHEASLGFDVAFSKPGAVILLQFKLGEELRRFHRHSPTQPIPLLERPFWRYRIDTTAPQFHCLVEFEQGGAEVYYVAPRFSHWSAYERAFQAGEVLERSLIVKPSEIQRGLSSSGNVPGMHRIVYDHSRRYVCSEPASIKEERPAELATRLLSRAGNQEQSLEQRILRLAERRTIEGGTLRLSSSRRQSIFARAKRPVDAQAAIIGLEAWSQGAQLLFVTGNRADQVAHSDLPSG